MNDLLTMALDYLKTAGVIQLTFGIGVGIINLVLSMVFGREKVRY